MDFVNEDELQAKIVKPTLDRLENDILPTAIAKLETMLRSVLDGADIHIHITLKPKA